MAKLSNLKRIIKEDFPDSDQDFIDKLAGTLNPYLEQIAQAFNKNINLDNLSREVITVDVENGTGGKLKTITQFKIGLTSRILGLNIIKADNLTNSSIYPTQAPWISWAVNGQIITVNSAVGIQDNNKYRLTIEVIS